MLVENVNGVNSGPGVLPEDMRTRIGHMAGPIDAVGAAEPRQLVADEFLVVAQVVFPVEDACALVAREPRLFRPI
ncbi:hypothetical protein G9C98_007956 [Cotesia typhae]|uniref:Uncharacterized protein n=1 Tax=Cotesia typhae TaxID=2053667 RepID=A0A8J5QLK7_9HYME|nr:hypothetical protein G9C98_007956 [Cotesia typhae]